MDGQYYIHRVVGLPDDTLDINNDVVTINGKQSKETFIKETKTQEANVSEFEEELPNGHKHRIYKFKEHFDSTKAYIKNIIVPDNNYYLLGDNRDYVMDSRYIGAIFKDRIYGKILYSYWGKSIDRINIDFRDK